MSPQSNSATIHGWHFSATSDVAIGSKAREELAESFRIVHVPIPEMVFLNSSIEIEHVASGFKLRFCAHDALQDWAEAMHPEW